MYEDTWYSFANDTKEELHKKPSHLRRESLLKQPNDVEGIASKGKNLGIFVEEDTAGQDPPQASVARRAKSYSDFYHVTRAHLTREARKAKREEHQKVSVTLERRSYGTPSVRREAREAELLDATQEKFQLYRDQLALTERHLANLFQDTTVALDSLTALSASFRSVEVQTSAFQSQCEDLLEDQKRLKSLRDEVGVGLQYYGYLEPITRRLNAPGASRAIGDDSFVEMLSNLESCIDYMTEHIDHREAETYLGRYRSLLARTLNLLRIKFDDILKEDTAQALKRMPEGRMNMTTVFIAQAPQRNPVADELEGFMTKLQGVVYGSRLRHYDVKGRVIRSNYEAEYVDVFRQLVESYLAWRRQIVTPILDKLLYREEMEGESAESAARWSRDCFQAVLEVAANENAKYGLLFIGSHSIQSQPHNNGPVDPFHLHKAYIQNFLSDKVRSSLAIIRPQLTKFLDIQCSLQLVTWLGQYDYQNVLEDNGAASSHEDEALEDLDSDAFAKSRLAMQFKEALIHLVFDRMNVVLLRDIEKYVAKPEDLEPRSATAVSKSAEEAGRNDSNGTTIVEEDELTIDVDPSRRAENILGPGLSNAYAPVKIAVRLLAIYHDLTRDARTEEGKNDIAYNIIHQTCQTVMSASAQVASKFTPIDGKIFAIKNLVLLKNIVLTYEISGSRKNAAIDFSPMWNSFADLRSRGGLFDVRAYYDLVTTQHLLPRVVENLEDARAELDGLMRATITQFREQCADMLFNRKSLGPVKDEWKVRASLQAKLDVMFSHEKQLRENLWAAVEETISERKQGNGNRVRKI